MAKPRDKKIKYKRMTATYRWFLNDKRYANGDNYVGREVRLTVETENCPDFVKPGNYEMGTEGYWEIIKHMREGIPEHTIEMCIHGTHFDHNVHEDEEQMLREEFAHPDYKPMIARKYQQSLTQYQFEKIVGETRARFVEYDVSE